MWGRPADLGIEGSARDPIVLPDARLARHFGNFMRLFDRQGRTCEGTRTLFGFIPDSAEKAWGDE